MRMKILYGALALAAVVGLVLTNSFALSYFGSPASIKYPKVDHYHFRTRLFVEGKAIDFGQQNFQETYEAGQCTAELADTPIHFHDNKDQMTHIHWDDMTGGLMLKYYGWNFIGGSDDALGRRYDQNFWKPSTVATRGDVLPAVSDGTNYFVYISTAEGYKQKNWHEFLSQDFEVFFEKQSNLPEASLWDKLFPKASAHGTEVHEEGDLKALNNLIGDVVIFAQKDTPNNEQIQSAFDGLIDLPESTCGG